MPQQQPVIPHEPIEDPDDWLQEPDELPPRPRRRLLGVGGNRAAVALLGVLLTACGFIGGVLVEKGQGSSNASAAGAVSSLASRFRALRGAGAGAAFPGGSGAAVAGGSGAASGGFTRPTAGTVAYIAGSTLYVTNAEGNTVKVRTSPATSVSKTVTTHLDGIHPGETVTVTGATGSNGSITAESISVGASSGGLAALFGSLGGGGASSSAGASSSGGGSSGGGASGAPSLFGGG